MPATSGIEANNSRHASGASQFRAVLRKNWLLRLRGGRKWFGLGGWFAAALDVLVPVFFFLVMCIPKHYVDPMPTPPILLPLYSADAAAWGQLYEGPAARDPNGAARLLFAPNTTEVTRLMLLLAKGAACPPASVGPRAKSSSSFYHYFSASAKAAASAHPTCASGGAHACRAEPACYLPLFQRQMVGYASADEAAHAAAATQPDTVDALLDFTAWQQVLDARSVQQQAAREQPQHAQPHQQPQWQLLEHSEEERWLQQLQQRPLNFAHQQPKLQQEQELLEVQSRFVYAYTLRLNHSDVPPTRLLLNQFDLLPGSQYRQYWFFANLQTLVEHAVLAHAAAEASAASNSSSSNVSTTLADAAGDRGTWLAAAAAESPPLLPLSLSLKPFPWSAVTLDLGATTAALFFNMLLVFAFLQPTRSAIMSVVQERELLLREGMRILGLQDGAYWASWFLTHWSGMAISGTLCTLVGLYPFEHSSFVLMLVFYWLVAASLLLFAYCTSTLFSQSRVAGGAAAVLYSLAMMPGFLMPSLQPYGGPGWALACLLPPSTISLFASVLVKHEAVQQGLTWHTLAMPVTVEHSFSAATVYHMLLLDVVLYSVLLWYLDKVMPSGSGQQLPWTFPLSPDFWRHLAPRASTHAAVDGGTAAAAAAVAHGSQHGGGAAVRIVGLRKVFRTTDGMDKVAVDGLSLEIPAGQITALLGHNGAGKTTTISILTGLLPATAGDVFFFPSGGNGSGGGGDGGPCGGGGLSVRRDMAAIRGSLGVCPQFDVLWPQLTVREHLELYAAIKGYATGAEQAALAEAAAAEVGLAPKLGSAAGELSGGQRRKLSVALAFVGDPAVVILDEPTSGMDPYTRRFTWGVIQARRAQAGTAVLLTSHSMEEADLLADGVAIMAHGRLAALGSPLELKSEFGVGYSLILSLAGEIPAADGSATASGAPESSGGSGGMAAGGAVAGGAAAATVAQLSALVQRHVPEAQLLSASGSEVAYCLPKESAATFPPLLRALEQERKSKGLGVSGYGLTETTLEEVFLRVSKSAGAAASAAAVAAANGSHGPQEGQQGEQREEEGEGQDEFVVINLPRQDYLKGWGLWRQQLRALLAKRALCASRDGWVALVQVAVPVLLMLMALWSSHMSAALPHQPPLLLDRPTVLSGNPAAFGVAADLRGPSGSSELEAFLAGYPDAKDTGASRILTIPFIESLKGSLDGWLLDQWHNSSTRWYDAFFLHSLPTNLSGMAVAGGSTMRYSVMANQTAIHGLPAAITQVHAALLRWLTGEVGADIQLTSHPFPALSSEKSMRVTEEAGMLLLVMCMVLATSVLSASFAIFLVRERASGSKAVQLIAGAAPSAFWTANMLFDMFYYSVPATLMIALLAAFRLPAFTGLRLAAAAAMLWGFAPASLCLTYLVQMAFQDEVRVLMRTNSLYFTTGYLGYLAVWVLDTISEFLHYSSVDRIRAVLRLVFQSLSPHFCVARGLQKISTTYNPGNFVGQVTDALATAAGTSAASGGWWPRPKPRQSPFAWDVTGELLATLGAQAVLYGSAILLVEAGVLPRVWRRAQAAWTLRRSGGYQPLLGLELQEQVASQRADAAAEEGEREDEDVAAERLAIQSGRLASDRVPVLLRGVSKSFWQAPESSKPRHEAGHGPAQGQEPRHEPRPVVHASSAVHAVQDLWLSIGKQRLPATALGQGGGGPGAGECFGLLGVNGAGKTTTFKMLTGEVAPDTGDALVGGLSLLQQPAAARQLLGYCPQASALPAQMTGREVVRMYSRLRGLPERLIEVETTRMLKQLGLAEYGDRTCGSYSGGNRRKLSVAAALVGGAEVVLLDEPSTGMDPGARQALWGVIKEEMAGGRTVLLTSHSMEECEAVCGRVGVMSGGHLCALGSVQHLKNKHGQGYSLEMRVPPHCEAAATELVTRCCPDARCRPQHWQAAAAAASHLPVGEQGGGSGGGGNAGTHLSFMIPQQQADLPSLFAALEAARSGGICGDGSAAAAAGAAAVPQAQPLVLEYSLSQTTLEQVFLTLAAAAALQQQQEGERE